MMYPNDFWSTEIGSSLNWSSTTIGGQVHRPSASPFEWFFLPMMDGLQHIVHPAALKATEKMWSVGSIRKDYQLPRIQQRPRAMKQMGTSSPPNFAYPADKKLLGGDSMTIIRALWDRPLLSRLVARGVAVPSRSWLETQNFFRGQRGLCQTHMAQQTWSNLSPRSDVQLQLCWQLIHA